MNEHWLNTYLTRNLNYHPKERLLILVDETHKELGKQLYSLLQRFHIEVYFLHVPTTSSSEVPPSVERALESVQIAFLLVANPFYYSPRFIHLVHEKKIRAVRIPLLDLESLSQSLTISPDEVHRTAQNLLDFFQSAHWFKLTTPLGTDLIFKRSDIPPFVEEGLIPPSGGIGFLPFGEISLIPEPSSVEGTLYLDGSCTGTGLLQEPYRVLIKEGQIRAVNDPRFHPALTAISAPHRIIGEIGLGLNPQGELRGLPLSDEKVFGTAHIALGNNLFIGGNNDSPSRFEGIFFNPTLSSLETPRPSSPVKKTLPFIYKKHSPLPGVQHEFNEAHIDWGTYKLLFENSNDPQYILDLESQILILVNTAFCRLTGYSREELESGKITAPDLTPQTHQQELEERRRLRLTGTLDTDIYDFKLRTRAGELKSVEVSVQKTILYGREIMVGSVRDLSERQALIRKLRESAIESAKTANRIHNLTEKIKGVPPLISTLLKASSEEDFCHLLSDLLPRSKELAFQEVSLFLSKENHLTHYPSSSSHPSLRDPVMQKLAAESFSGEEIKIFQDYIYFFPLHGREKILGVLMTVIDPEEIKLMAGNEQVQRGYFETLRTISDVLGLAYENILLYKKLELQSLTDSLTGAGNRRSFDRKLTEEFERSRRYKRPLSLITLDLDHFKDINDTYGHPVGDELLQKAAVFLKDQIRETDAVYRWGGDEFALIMPETPVEQAQKKAEFLQTLLNSTPLLSPQDIPLIVSFSIGVCGLGPAMQSVEDLIRKADQALYSAKRTARGSVVTL